VLAPPLEPGYVAVPAPPRMPRTMADPHNTIEQEPKERFLISARKYRPQTFDDLVAQEHVTATLRNAIRLDRLAHAYLFSGPRGVGKTTAARLLAKAINCQTPLDQRDNAEPCRTCETCRSFEQGRDMNVIEIDAASNNSVNDIRELRETVRIPPQGARKKVYILDEVHMLSTAAFNAFLKTLEEPPEHALFIFATTEPHKVLPTILSRCQRFDFRRIAVDESVSHLREICEQEGITTDDATLHLIARRADGALRDALSLLDQSVALCGREIEYEDLARQLGVVDRDLFFAAADAARERNTAKLLQLVDVVVSRGYDLGEFMGGLVEHFRHLYVVVSTGGAELIDADAAMRSRYLSAAHGLQAADLVRAMVVIEEGEGRLRTSTQPRLAAELALLRLAHLEPVADLQALIENLKRFENERGGGASVARPPARPDPAARPGPATAEPLSGYVPAQRSQERPPPDSPAPPGSSDDEGEPPAPPPPPRPAPPAATTPKPRDTSTDVFGPPAIKRQRAPNGDKHGAAQVMAPDVEAAIVDDEHFGATLGRVRDAWPEVVRIVEQQSRSVATVLAQSQAARLHSGTVTITVPDDFSQEVLRRERMLFCTALKEVLGEEPPPFSVEVQHNGQETADDEDPFETVKRLRHEHPTLRFLFERFGAEFVWT
jgi:DNA polymerase III subunit gamma/tau